MLRRVWQLITYFRSHIRFKIILPFAVLTLIVALSGVYLNTHLVSGSLEERFTRQLIETASAAADGLAQREQGQLEDLRVATFTKGINAAILDRDKERLQTLLFPVVINDNIARVDVIDIDGYQLLGIYRPPGGSAVEDYGAIDGADVTEWPIWPLVNKVLSGEVDEIGDKYVAQTTIGNAKFFSTVGPVKQGDQIVGAILVSSYTKDILRSLSQTTFAEISLYDLDGHLFDTTFPSNQRFAQLLEIGSEGDAMLAVDGESSLQRSIDLRGREYELLYGVFRARGEPIGFYSVGLQTAFIGLYQSTARNQMVFIFAVALLFVFGIGYVTANTITGRLQNLMENAIAVAGGDFSRRTQVSSGDEIGSLARSLDHMTESLANYTSQLQNRIDELIALYESSTAVTVESGLNLDHVLQAVVTSLKGVVQGADQVMVHLLDENSQVLVPKAVRPNASEKFPTLSYTEKGTMWVLLAEAKPQVVELSDIEACVLEGAFSTNGVSDVLIAPLVAGQETVGMLTLTPDIAYPENKLVSEDNQRLLGTFANQAAMAVKNAQLFEATQRAYEELQQLDNLKTQFINIAAHELRTPLGAMLGYASFVEKRVPPKLHRSTRFLIASMLRMRTMVDAMLAIQRLDAGTTFLRLATVDIREILKKVITDYQPVAELEGHTIEVNLPDQLPSIQADPEKISLVLSNLLSNAIKFTPEGGRIDVAAKDYKKGILVSVKDNGAGIATEDQERIFERFYQVRAEHLAGHGGMGIGLTIVKNLVELHQGQVWVESEPGQGSTFLFTLPQEAPATIVDSPPVEANSHQHNGNAKILAKT